MVHEVRPKNRRSTTVQVDYLIQIQEIKPWPPSPYLSSLRSVLLQWENGDRCSGYSSPVTPSTGSGVGDGKIKFNDSFRLPLVLSRECYAKDADMFQKNCLEFNLYEPRKDKTIKGQLIGTAIIDLAEYGVLRETVCISAQMNCKRSFRNTVQPLLFIKVQPYDKQNSSSSSRESLPEEASLDKDGVEIVSTVANGENIEKSEASSFTGDGVSRHSSLRISPSAVEATGSQPSPYDKNAAETVKESTRRDNRFLSLPLEPDPSKSERLLMSFRRSSIDASSNSIPRLAKVTTSDVDFQAGKKLGLVSSTHSHINEKDSTEKKRGEALQEDPKNRQTTNSTDDAPSNIFLPDVIRMPVQYLDDAPTSSGQSPGFNGNSLAKDRLRPQSPLVSARSNGSIRESQFAEVVKEIDISEDGGSGTKSIRKIERKDAVLVHREARNGSFESKIQQLEHRIEKLEGELRESAAVEVALYSVVAEHGSSTNKVHAPARRLSRPYLHACKLKSQARKASAARSAVSGLVLVAKACGSDIARLTFWLSNSVVLRAIISQAIGKSQQQTCAANAGGKGYRKRSPAKWESTPIKHDKKFDLLGEFHDWENPNTFVTALEKIEAWIFSRVVESMWWQTFTPHMQSSTVNTSEQNIDSSLKKSYERTSSLGDQEQVNYSLDLWKKVFKDAYERLCPVRAGGHECGCLPILPKLIMEQCIARLDVAMFNAVLRESTDEIPTDPVSDPISDSKVLPIPAGKSSFGAGAQLKNAIGNWSRWLTDLFNIDDGGHHEDQSELVDLDDKQALFESFHHLSALSDLMMLPKDMLLDDAIRKEVCPTFDAPLIKKILNNYSPDEFCQDSIPNSVFEALDSENPPLDEEDSTNSTPCRATPVTYLPPAATSIADFMEVGSGPQLRRSRSSVLWKSYTSDDELDELESPLTSIVTNNSYRGSAAASPSRWKPDNKSEGHRNTVRYQLLREIWRDGDLNFK